jgi:phosphoenolpyruvate carboxykinase (ATP)
MPTMSAPVLAGTGVASSHPVHANLSAPMLVQHALARGEGRLTADGAFLALTGQHTGRSVQDKFVVDDASVSEDIWWGRINQKMEAAKFAGLAGKVRGWLGERPMLFTQDLYAGADPRTASACGSSPPMPGMPCSPATCSSARRWPSWRLHARLHHPARPGIRGRPRAGRLPHHHLHRAVLRAEDHPDRRHLLCRRDQEEHLHRDELAAARARRAADALLANVGRGGDVALFFGLSGTGKTTLSATPSAP